MVEGTSRFLVLNGVHTAGKTTAGEFLAEEGYDFRPEIAARLMEREGFEGSRSGTEEFQRLVHEREVDRERRLLSAGRDAVIETWHTGCIAHTREVVGNDLAARQRERLEAVLRRPDVEVTALYISVPPEVVPERSDRFDESDEEIVDFYARVGENIRELYRECEIPYVEIENVGIDVREFEAEVLDVAERTFD